MCVVLYARVCVQVCIFVEPRGRQVSRPGTLHLVTLKMGFSLNLKLCWWPESASGLSVSVLDLGAVIQTRPASFMGPEI